MPSLLDYLVENEPLFRKSRLPSLYSDLSIQRSNNSEGFAANTTAWNSALTVLALAGKLPSEQRLLLNTNDKLLSALSSPQYGRPVGLGAVIDDSVRSGQMLDLKDFTSSEKSIYTKSWFPAPWSIALWSLRTIGVIGSGSYNVSGRLREGKLVLIPALEAVSKLVISWQQSQPQNLTDRIYTRDAFSKAVSSLLNPPTPPLSQEDLRILLIHLSRDNPILSYTPKTVKLKSPSFTNPEPVTEEDESIANLNSLITQLNVSILHLSAQITNSTEKAKTSLTNKNKPLALSALRSKKMYEKQLEQRTSTLAQLEDVFTQIQNAADQVTIVETLKASGSALKTLNKKVGSVENVDAIMDDLREEMSKTAEVGGVINEPLSDDAVLAEGDLDDELAAMEREEKQKVELAETRQREEEEKREAEQLEKRLEGLGNVPNGIAVGQSRQKDGEMDVDMELASSVEKMQQLDLGMTQHDEKEKERIAQMGNA